MKKWGANAGLPDSSCGGADAGRGPVTREGTGGGTRGGRSCDHLTERFSSDPRGQGPQDGNHPCAPPEKVGWVRKFCGKGIFREIWKNRYVVLKGDQLYISEKEVGALACNCPVFP